MPSYTAQMPSGSTAGGPVLISSNATTLHTAVSGSTGADEIYLWVSNIGSSAEQLMVAIGSTSVVVGYTVAANSLPLLVLPGVRVANGLAITSSGSTSNKLSALVNVNRITF